MVRKGLVMKQCSSLLLSLFVLLSFSVVSLLAGRRDDDCYSAGMIPSMVKKGHRKSLMVTEYGEISAVDIFTGTTGAYHLEFMNLEPNSLFLPVLLHADMVFYINSGSGKLSWAEDGKEMKRMNIRKGDVYRLHQGSVFFLQSSLDSERRKLRIYAIFSNTDENIYEPSIGAYSIISDLVLGFDRKVLQSAFKVSDDVIEEMTSATRPPPIVHAVPQKKSIFQELENRLLKTLTGNKDDQFYSINGGSKKTKTFNIFDADPDFQNCNGWSVTVDRGDLKSLRGSNVGVFMVNLAKGAMMGPHWNPMATEIAIVLHGRGMVRVVCSGNISETECKHTRFRVEEGDVFAVPRFHPMAHMSFNNDSFVFMGFSTSTGRNYPQFLAGKSSVLQTLNKEILALSFNVGNTTIDELLTRQKDEIILECTSCAEEEESIMREAMERERQEEEATEREEEEEERKRREEEEEERERKEEERKRREEEEEERERKEEERKRREEEEDERERKEEERKRREEEEDEREREEEEEEEREREEEERKRREEEEEREREEEERKRTEEEEEERERESQEEEVRKREEEEERQRKEEAERAREERREREQKEAERKQKARKREEEEEERQREEEAERARKDRREREKKEAEGKQKEEKRRREEAARRKREQARKEEEEERQRRQRQAEEEARKEREREEEEHEAEPEPEEDTKTSRDQPEEVGKERQGGGGQARRALRNFERFN